MKIILTTLFFIFVGIASNYAMFAFIESEFNPSLWGVNNRENFAGFAFSLILVNLFFIIFIIIDRNDK